MSSKSTYVFSYLLRRGFKKLCFQATESFENIGIQTHLQAREEFIDFVLIHEGLLMFSKEINLFGTKTLKGFQVKNWMLIASSALAIRECATVVSALNALVYPLGILAGIIFVCVGGYLFCQAYKRLSPWHKSVCFMTIGVSSVLIAGNAGAAHAQFLQNAEDFFIAGAGNFGLGDSITLLINLIFWLIRGAFVIGVAIALLPAIQAAREGEEWRSLAKTPMLVVGIVLAGATSVDFLTAGVGG